MIIRIIIIIASILLSVQPLIADIKIYLSPGYEMENDSDELRLGEIAVISCTDSDCIDLIQTPVPRELFSDGYIDKGEIVHLLKNSVNSFFIIYGSAVRISAISNIENSNKEIIQVSDIPEIIIKKGDYIDLVVLKKGISIKLMGRAMEDGKAGDLINVKINLSGNSRGKLVKGLIRSRELAEAVI